MRFSLATDLTAIRSFKENQRFFAFGQTVHFHFHVTETEGIYAFLSYYTNGKFTNISQAQAKSPLAFPQTIDYENKSLMRLKFISVGWRHNFKGSSFAESGVNTYGYAGFGLIIGNIENEHSVQIDTSQYDLPVLSGTASFKRLTFDLGLGIEKPVGADVFLYLEGRVHVPTSGYPSKHILVNNNAPLTATVNAGLRILF
jgi:hypothetical protein